MLHHFRRFAQLGRVPSAAYPPFAAPAGVYMIPAALVMPHALTTSPRMIGRTGTPSLLRAQPCSSVGGGGGFDRLHVHEHGSGKVPVILLHGYLSSSNFWKAGVLANLPNDNARAPHPSPSSDATTAGPGTSDATTAGPGTSGIGAGPSGAPAYRFLAPDLLGFGQSPWPSKEHCGYTAAEHTDVVSRDVVRAFGTAEVGHHLVGHSLGAVIALEVAAQNPKAVRTVTLLSPPYYATKEDARADAAKSPLPGSLFVRYPNFAWVTCQVVCQRRKFWEPILLRMVQNSRLPKEIFLDYLKHSYHSADATFKACVLEHRMDAAAQTLEEHGVRVLVLHAGKDTTVPVAQSVSFAKKFKNVELIEVPGSHSFPVLKSHDLLPRLLSEFERGDAAYNGVGDADAEQRPISRL